MSSMKEFVERWIEAGEGKDELTRAEGEAMLDLIKLPTFLNLFALLQGSKMGALSTLAVMPMADQKDLVALAKMQGRVAGIDVLAQTLIEFAELADAAAEEDAQETTASSKEPVQ